MKFLLSCLLLISLSFLLAAQQPNYKIYGLKEGLNRHKVYALQNDNKGRLWVGTEQGMFLFDGYTFQPLIGKALVIDRLRNSSIQTITPYRNGDFLITAANAIYRFNPTTLRAIKINTDRAIGYVSGVALSADSTCFFTDSDRRIFSLDEEKITFRFQLHSSDSTSREDVLIIPENNHQLWVKLAYELVFVDLQLKKIMWRYSRGRNALSKNRFDFIKRYNDHQLFISDKDGPYLLDTRTKTTKRYAAGRHGAGQLGKITQFEKISEQECWLVTTKKGLVKLDRHTGSLKPLNHYLKEGIQAAVCNQLYVPEGNIIWQCSNAGLIATYKAMRYVQAWQISEPDNPNQPITTRAIYPRGKKLGISTHLYDYMLDEHTGSIEQIKRNDYHSLTGILQSDTGWIYVSSEQDGFARFRPPDYRVENEFYRKIPNIRILNGYGIMDYNKDTIAVGTSDGIWLYIKATAELRRLLLPGDNNTEPPSNNAHSFCSVYQFSRATDKSIWVSGPCGLHHYGPTFRALKNVDNPIYKRAVRCFWIAPDNSVYAGSLDSGLLHYHSSGNLIESFNTTHGLPSNVIYSMVPDGDSVLWIGTADGLSRFQVAEKQFRNFTTKDGLPNNEFNSQSTYKSPDGRIYMGVMNGIIYFKPSELFKTLRPPNVLLSAIVRVPREGAAEVTMQQLDSAKTVYLKPADLYIEVFFTLDDYTAPGENRYQYLLEGVDHHWNYIGPQHSLRFYSLPAGTHRLRIRGINPDGIATQNELQVKVIVVLAFYKRWWFVGLVMLVIIGSIYSFYRYRLAQLRRIDKIRNNIARDLHDDVGSTLSSISLLSSMARKELDGDVISAGDTLKKIGSDARGMLQTMSDIIWAVNPRNDSLDQMLARMRQFATQTLEARDILVKVDFDKHGPGSKLAMEKRRNLYLVFKEMVNNAAKYSNAKNVTLSLQVSGSHLQLTIQDDGQGFDTTAITMGGNGLRNMQQRVTEMKGQLELQSTKGTGTKIAIYIPVP